MMMVTTTNRTCSNCGSPDIVAKGLCWACYQYQRRKQKARPLSLSATPLEKFLALTESESLLGCWLWRGNLLDGHPRYGQRYAHRWAWEMWKGIKPPGRLLMACGQKLCVNPLHALDNRITTV